jgi:hypothetical protein
MKSVPMTSVTMTSVTVPPHHNENYGEIADFEEKEPKMANCERVGNCEMHRPHFSQIPETDRSH